MAFSGKYQELNGLRLGDDFGRNLNQEADHGIQNRAAICYEFTTASRQGA
jgi:hypothetical protein